MPGLEEGGGGIWPMWILMSTDPCAEMVKNHLDKMLSRGWGGGGGYGYCDKYLLVHLTAACSAGEKQWDSGNLCKITGGGGGIQPGIDYQWMADSLTTPPPPTTFPTPRAHTWHQVPHPNLNLLNFHNTWVHVHVLRTVTTHRPLGELRQDLSINSRIH